MRSKLWILLVLVITLNACQDKGEYLDGFDEYSEQEGPFDDFEEENHGTGEEGEGGHEHNSEGGLTLYEIQGTTISKIKDYNVNADLLSFQKDYQKHFDMWEFVTRLLPEGELGRLVEFEVFHGGGQLLGFVEPIQGDLSRWKFALAIDAADKLDEIDFENMFTYVTIHEFGHVVTLNETQINANSSSCNNFETNEGCTASNSYINRLFEIGWADIYDEFQGLESEDEIFDFYEKYKDRFVSDYAATNPGEDIAEVFSFFITMPERPSGNSIADQKIQMLYEYDELVQLRQQIRQSETVRALPAGSWLNNPLRKQFKIGCKHKH